MDTRGFDRASVLQSGCGAASKSLPHPPSTIHSHQPRHSHTAPRSKTTIHFTRLQKRHAPLQPTIHSGNPPRDPLPRRAQLHRSSVTALSPRPQSRPAPLQPTIHSHNPPSTPQPRHNPLEPAPPNSRSHSPQAPRPNARLRFSTSGATMRACRASGNLAIMARSRRRVARPRTSGPLGSRTT